jgi:hypothetical protein
LLKRNCKSHVSQSPRGDAATPGHCKRVRFPLTAVAYETGLG